MLASEVTEFVAKCANTESLMSTLRVFLICTSEASDLAWFLGCKPWGES